MLIFLDTEFTELSQKAQLISLGLIDENGSTFYAEFDDFDINQASDFVVQNIIPNLDFYERKPFVKKLNNHDVRVNGSKGYIKDFLLEWLSYYDNIQIVSDVCHFDFVLFLNIFDTIDNLPENISLSCHDINQDIARYYHISDKEAFDKSRESMLPPSLQNQDSKHNSLYDATVIKYIYNLTNS
jgi:hypothetical protein